MLNISKTGVSEFIVPKKYSTLVAVENKISSKVLQRLIYSSLAIFIIILLLPWTQNIRSTGYVTTLKPDQKPQRLNSVIAGQIERWYVQEGDFVNKGDTLLKISEVKEDYFDTKLLSRTQDQVDLKRESVKVYDDKVLTQEAQLRLLKQQRDLKLSQANIKIQQARLKVQNDSIAYQAAYINLATVKYQFQRFDTLYQRGLKSLSDLENRNLTLQKALSSEMEAKNKWLNSQNEIINLQLEISNIKMSYQADYNKIQSDKFTTISNKLDTETNLAKLENQYSNYEYRNDLYFITSPVNGYITKTNSNGIGEMIKEGQEILSIMPINYDLAVEVYIKPIDLPLVKKGEEVRIQFDGWPAIVFSGWPNTSYGTYSGKIYAIDQFISSNGKYRILVQPDPKDHPWPDALRYGSGASSLIMLQEVQIWYELWRKLNGFPPDFYTTESDQKSEKKTS
jgi:adhesin transport system membrane fusion protein